MTNLELCIIIIEVIPEDLEIIFRGVRWVGFKEELLAARDQKAEQEKEYEVSEFHFF
jgi:hypothetical protein